MTKRITWTCPKCSLTGSGVVAIGEAFMCPGDSGKCDTVCSQEDWQPSGLCDKCNRHLDAHCFCCSADGGLICPGASGATPCKRVGPRPAHFY